MKTKNQKKSPKNNSTMRSLVRAKYEEIATRKLLTAYGGPGSIVETRGGSVLIEPFSEWDAFKKGLSSEVNIEDNRLIQRLRNWFPALERLVRMPVNSLDDEFKVKTAGQTVKARYFPEWMFSPITRRFDRVENWYRHWISVTKGDESAQTNFHPPKCFQQYQDFGKGIKKRKYSDLEQVRFIMISPSGHIADVPWDRWVFARADQLPVDQELAVDAASSGDGEEKQSKIWLDFGKEIPHDVYFRYVVSDERSDLTGIAIFAYDVKDREAKHPIARQSLTGLFNLRVPQKYLVSSTYPHGDDLMKVVIRSSNSVYYPNIVQSLYLPVEKFELWSADSIDYIKKRHAKAKSNEEIAEDLEDAKQIKRTAIQIEQLINNDFVPIENNDIGAEEDAYRQSEYEFITKKNERFHDEGNRLTIEPALALTNQVAGIKMIYRIDRLKVTSVQTSYTRQEPLDRAFFLNDDEMDRTDGVIIRKRYTSKWRKDTIKYFPAVESFGEGLFVDLDEVQLAKWLDKSQVAARAGIIHYNYDQNRMGHVPRLIDAKFVLIHTLSHLLIKELEFLCGYPVSSLQERLYVGPAMQGLLIYTIAGAEGSYGGLTSLAKSGALLNIIKSAFLRARNCASDPICYHTGDDNQGQGVGGTNLAACYSCAMLPETSCEEFNRFLDRKLVVDNEIGYFGELLE